MKKALVNFQKKSILFSVETAAGVSEQKYPWKIYRPSSWINFWMEKCWTEIIQESILGQIYKGFSHRIPNRISMDIMFPWSNYRLRIDFWKKLGEFLEKKCERSSRRNSERSSMGISETIHGKEVLKELLKGTHGRLSGRTPEWTLNFGRKVLKNFIPKLISWLIFKKIWKNV